MLVTALLNDEWEDLEDGLQIQSAYDSNVVMDTSNFVTAAIVYQQTKTPG